MFVGIEKEKGGGRNGLVYVGMHAETVTGEREKTTHLILLPWKLLAIQTWSHMFVGIEKQKRERDGLVYVGKSWRKPSYCYSHIIGCPMLATYYWQAYRRQGSGVVCACVCVCGHDS